MGTAPLFDIQASFACMWSEKKAQKQTCERGE